MTSILQALGIAFNLIFSGDGDLAEIVGLSMWVTINAVIASCIGGMTIGAILTVKRFPGRLFLIACLNALMGLPPVVVGLFVYLMLSRAGPFGVLGLLYSPTAMIIAQVILITPLVAALSRQVLEDMNLEYDELFKSLGLSAWGRVRALIWDARTGLLTVALAGFGRAVAEVGAVMIVGGNINHLTRVMTTSIALETSKGELTLALALGIVLIFLAVLINLAAMGLRGAGGRIHYA